MSFEKPNFQSEIGRIKNRNKNSLMMGISKIHDYGDLYNKFHEESLKISRNLENSMKKSYSPTPTLEVYEKVDENKALQAAKEREDQCRLIESQRYYNQYLAEKEIKQFQFEQINYKRKLQERAAKEEKDYGESLKTREKYAEKLLQEQTKRFDDNRKIYLQALNGQIQEKTERKLMIKRIDSANKKFRVQDQNIQNTGNCIIKTHSSNNTPTRLHSPNSFLAQYGNFMIIKGKNN
ncbi:hypothetical protein SteCoe_8777 [Stentor coeruleus]|uniref:Uncharacterized protein n=1 Tax=Stentor coeruleus TaxID=5963 RepID=A0A1R2CJE4_9CILI|nr:hypothetical protein SteCoe_8777 [Stentor coeruleus]